MPERRCVACDRMVPPVLVFWHGHEIVATCDTDYRAVPAIARPPGFDRMMERYRLEERPRRIDAEYCSAACRQATHRDRESALGPEVLAALKQILGTRTPSAARRGA